jgi:amidase
MRRFSRERTTLFSDPAASPLAELRDGERVVVETADSLCGLAKARAPGGMHIDDVVEELGGACPLTGPFYVSGARAGGALEVHVHRVDPFGEEGWTGVFGGFGALDHERYSLGAAQPEPEIRVVPFADGVARFPCRGGDVSVPMRPFLGTVGVAPRRERRMTFSQSPEYLGDVDVPSLGAGAVLVLAVNVDGALVSFGDVHGSQGAGEITGAALEIRRRSRSRCTPAHAARPGSWGSRRSTPTRSSARSQATRAYRWPTAPGRRTPTSSRGWAASTGSRAPRPTSCSHWSAGSRSAT